MTGCYNNSMGYFLSRRAVLKWLEVPSVYQIAKDELYELDSDSFRFMKDCASDGGCSSKDGAFIDYCMEEGLLTRDPVSVRRPALKQAPLPSLRYLELQITDACNLRCKHCYIGDSARSELPAGTVHALLKEFEELQGLRVLVTGGEPLLHGRFNEINEMLPAFFFRKVLFTNGVLLKKDQISALKVDEIQVSIDGLEQAHDRLRGAGSYKLAMEAVKRSLDAGFDVSISTMAYRGNLDDFDSLEHQFKEMGIKDWTVDVPCLTGRLKDNRELFLSPEEGGKYLGYGYGGGLHSSGQGFGCGLHLLSVMANGKISKCTFYHDDAVGSADQGLLAAWRKIRPVRLSDLKCDCEYLEVCRGGCRYRAELLEGKGGKDRYRCMLYGII
jgi:radical SAM protein with 4Fe4S-binding SPASM domain